MRSAIVSRLLAPCCALGLLALCQNIGHADGFLTTTTPGFLVFEALEGHAAQSNIEFGIGTPAIGTPLAERQRIFTIHFGLDQLISSVTPSSTVNMGFFPAGSVLDFYNISDYGGGESWAFSSNLGSSPTSRDLKSFIDIDNSLGLGGSVIQPVGIDHWILHLDDAATEDDDDDEMILRVRVAPVPEPSSIALVVGGGILLLAGGLWRRRNSRRM
jgi:hypothetical protein